MTEEREDWLVWSHEHQMWWRPHRVGYTRNVLEAGLYTKSAAQEIAANAEPGDETALPAAPVFESFHAWETHRQREARVASARFRGVIEHLAGERIRE